MDWIFLIPKCINKSNMAYIQTVNTNQSNSLAKRMIDNFGMGDKLEVFFNEDIDDDSNPFLGRGLTLGDKYSEHTRDMIEKESLGLVKEAYKEANEILENNKDKLIEFSELLINNTIINSRDINGTFIF